MPNIERHRQRVIDAHTEIVVDQDENEAGDPLLFYRFMFSGRFGLAPSRYGIGIRRPAMVALRAAITEALAVEIVVD